MSRSHEEAGFQRTLRNQGRDLKHLVSGKSFRATVNRIGAYNLDAQNSDDPRGKRIMETTTAGCPPINKNDKVQDVKNSEIYLVVQIGLDGPDYSQKFMLAQTAGVKDA